MSRMALVVTFEIAPGRVPDFLELVRGHAKRCLEREEGCVHFDVMVPREGDNEVMLYEIYADDKALEAHRATRHLAMFRERAAEMIAGRHLVECLVEEL